MICGNFKATDRGFHGEIRFFGTSEKVEILRVDDKASDKSPDYRIVAADDESIEFGVGWLKSARDGKPYASFNLNPVLAPDVHLRLVSTKVPPSTSQRWTICMRRPPLSPSIASGSSLRSSTGM